MEEAIDLIRHIRITLLGDVQDLDLEQLNYIPKGFNNNIIWNLGHLVSTQAAVCYLRSGSEVKISDHIFKSYRKGTKPEQFVEEKEVLLIKDLMLSTLDDLREDYNCGLLDKYESWTPRYGVTISSIGQAIRFLPFHEGLHMGTITAQMKLLR